MYTACAYTPLPFWLFSISLFLSLSLSAFINTHQTKQFLANSQINQVGEHGDKNNPRCHGQQGQTRAAFFINKDKKNILRYETRKCSFVEEFMT